jgi:flagellar basal body-associated protein FliL
MDDIREQLNRPLWVGIISFVVGLLIGLVVLGWWLWPVQWTDAGPSDLRIEYQETYLRMAIDSYTMNQDAAVAQQRIAEVGENSAEILANIAAAPGTQNTDSIQAFMLFSGTEPPGEVVEQPGDETVAPEATTTPEDEPSLARKWLPWLCLITFLLAGALVLVFLFRNRSFSFSMPSTRKEAPPEAEYPEYTASQEEPPLAQFMTTYQVGNDLFDDSFSIDSPAGEFLGECGVGISETIGVGEPKKVTAFEVWLFDKNDIQTVTTVLMSKNAFEDDATRQRLSAKGEPVQAEPSRELILETATLRLEARVVDMSYGSGGLPPESFFDRLTLELVAWPKG